MTAMKPEYPRVREQHSGASHQNQAMPILWSPPILNCLGAAVRVKAMGLTRLEKMNCLTRRILPLGKSGRGP